MTTKPLLKIQNITCQYDEKKIIENMSFSIKRGTFTAIIGPNGVGKTTLLKTITGVLKPQEGAVFLQGDNVLKLSRRKLAQKIAVVSQHVPITFRFTVEQVVMMGRNPYIGKLKSPNMDDFDRVKQAMKQTGIESFAKRSITELSGGERQRVFIARALAQNPELIILDEPVSNLDLKYQYDILMQLKQLSNRGLTVIVVLHDINAAMQYADQLLLLKNGKLVGLVPSDKLTVKQVETIYDVQIKTIGSAENSRFFIANGLKQ